MGTIASSLSFLEASTNFVVDPIFIIPSSYGPETLLSGETFFSFLPSAYIRPPSQRPKLTEVKKCHGIPVIDFSSDNRRELIDRVRDACEFYGFFQILNHGVSKQLAEEMLGVARDFFDLPIEEKMKLYSNDPSKTLRLSTSFNVMKESVHNWRDYLRLHCHPLEDFIHEWPNHPSNFKSVVGEYSKQSRELACRVMRLISLSLGMREDYIESALGSQAQHMAVNYYSPCPEPELTYGLPAHTDPNALTILLVDGVAGLQVRKGQQWLAVNSIPDALIVNIGDQVQALSNGKYRSVWHQAVVNSERERISVASFICPSSDAMIEASEELVAGDGDQAGRIYKRFTYEEYYKKFWSRNLDDDQNCLELFRNG